ncbi:unnamed protein product, partial [marine sediment metagenome]
MEITRTETIRVSVNDSFSNICYLTKNLYNKANYIVRQEFFNSKKILNYYQIWQKTKKLNEYKNIPAQTAQQVLRYLVKNWKSFLLGSIKSKANGGAYYYKPKIPSYKKKNGKHIAVFTNQQMKILENGKLKFPSPIKIDVKTRLNKSVNLREVRVVPLGIGYKIEIVYKKLVRKESISKKRVASIDLGCINLITLVDNIGTRPIIVKDDGKGIKSIIQFYMKEKARLQKIYSNNGIKTGLKLSTLNQKFECKVQDYIHKLSRIIIKHCIKMKIGKLIIGQNIGWKQKSMMRRITNQMFINIPFSRFIQMLEHKGEEHGIVVTTIEEKYTSKCSFLDNEPVKSHKSFLGRRVKRG